MIEASPAMSWITPVSLFTAMMLTSRVGVCNACRSVIGIEQSVRTNRQENRLEPFGRQIANRFQDAFVLGGHGDNSAARIAHSSLRTARRP